MLRVISASAGSGKTYALVKDYLKIVLASDQFLPHKQIVAVTFTNKAVDEMKERIIEALICFSNKETIGFQKNLFNQAKEFRDINTYSVSSYDEFCSIMKTGGFIRCGWDGSDKTELKIKEETKATIRCIPFDEQPEGKHCILSGKPAKHEVIFAKAY